MNMHVMRPTRRGFLAGTAGLIIGFHLGLRAKAATGTSVNGAPAGAQGNQFAYDAFVRIAPDDTVTVLSKHLEMGQGPYTGLTTIVAEELDADWSQMRVVHSPADDKLYANLAYGAMGTGSSSSISNAYEQMRQAGATARAMLVQAAAEEWGVPAAEITVEKGLIRHAGSGRESGFGALAEKASQVKLNGAAPLKDPKDFRLIGSDRPRLDTSTKSDGTAIFTIDIQLPGMATAVVLHPTQFGAKPAKVDDQETRKVKGVIDVKPIPQGVAVFAETTFAALKGREALKVEWDTSAAEKRSSAEIIAEYQNAARGPGVEIANTGDIEKGFAGEGVKVFEAEYIFPYLAHAPMEPLDAVLTKAEDGTIDAYLGSQSPTGDQRSIAAGLGIDPSQVRIHTQFAGGSFGRRAEQDSIYAGEAAVAYKAFGQNRPLKFLWTREDDIRGGYYRPIYVHKLRGALAPDGTVAAWDQTIVGQSILAGTHMEAYLQGGPDATSHEGASDAPYAIANKRVTLHTTKTGVPVLWWRSVGHTHTGFTTETFLDELLVAAGLDPVEGRLALLKDQARHAAVLKRAAEMADWGKPVPAGRARGVAVHKSFGTYVAQVAEISVGPSGQPRVHKVWCAVDCGVAINPNIIRAQMEGGIGYGLGAVLFGEITLGQDGHVAQSNFHDYRSLRIEEMPEVEVDILASSEAPTGVGEPGVPPIGPAVANAWRVLTKQPVRRLPFQSPAV